MTPKEQLVARGYKLKREPCYWWDDTAVSGERAGLTAHYGDGNPTATAWRAVASVRGSVSCGYGCGPTLAIAERRAIADLKRLLRAAERQAQAALAAFARRGWK